MRKSWAGVSVLGLRVAASNRIWQAALDAIEKDMLEVVRGEGGRPSRPIRRAAKMAQSAAVAGWLALWATGSGGCPKSGMHAVDPPPPDAGGRNDAGKDGPLVVDMLPPDAGGRNDAAKEAPLVVDMVPPDANGHSDWPTYDPVPPDAAPRDAGIEGGKAIDADSPDLGRDSVDTRPLVVDALPPPLDARDSARDTNRSEMDFAPPDLGARDVRDSNGNEPPFMVDPVVEARFGVKVHEHWTDTAPARMRRSQDLPFCRCPEPRIVACWCDGRVVAQLDGVAGQSMSTRWQAQGIVEGEGSCVHWTPSSDEDQLDVAVRTADGLAFASLRLADIRSGSRG